MQTARKMAMAGDVQPFLLPKHGFYANGWPNGLSWRWWVFALRLECCLHLRLAAVGFWRGLTKAAGVFGVGRLYAWVIRGDGRIEHLGLVCTRLITDAGVAFLVDDWDNNAEDITNMNFHGCGTGTNAEVQGDTALQTESTAALNPDNTRATGTRSMRSGTAPGGPFPFAGSNRPVTSPALGPQA
jgi:hypothetical protein